MLMSIFQNNVTIIGCGSIGLSILEAVYDRGHKVTVTRTQKSASELEALHNFYKDISTTTNNREAVKNSDVILLCVKPYTIFKVCDEIKDCISEQLIISTGAKKTIAEVQEFLSGHSRIARMMSGLFVKDETIYYSLGTKCSSIDDMIISSLFKKVLKVNERLLAHRTQAACDIGIIAMDIEERIKELSVLGLEEIDARILYGETIQAIGKRITQGYTGEEIYELVTGGSSESFTAKIRMALEDEKHYDRIRKMVRDTIKALNGVT